MELVYQMKDLGPGAPISHELAMFWGVLRDEIPHQQAVRLGCAFTRSQAAAGGHANLSSDHGSG